MKKIVTAIAIVALVLALSLTNSFLIFTSERFGESSILINFIIGMILGSAGMITWLKINKVFDN